jgi:hypothetical protein
MYNSLMTIGCYYYFRVRYQRYICFIIFPFIPLDFFFRWLYPHDVLLS